MYTVDLNFQIVGIIMFTKFKYGYCKYQDTYQSDRLIIYFHSGRLYWDLFDSECNTMKTELPCDVHAT